MLGAGSFAAMRFADEILRQTFFGLATKLHGAGASLSAKKDCSQAEPILLN
jgi:hypothetical protein